MAVATLRCYEELNDFLPHAQRGRDIRLQFDPPAPVRHLVETVGVAAVPGSSFYHAGGEDRLRFTFSKSDETLEEACRRLEDLS
mgnify:CR=1 FL=1